MAGGKLPGEGPVRFGAVSLPAGKLIEAIQPTRTVAWATDDPVSGSGRVWAALSGLHRQTGLIPIQLDGLPGPVFRPWDNGEFTVPVDPREADGLDTSGVLERRWDGWLPWPEEEGPEEAEMRVPFTRAWPGMAAPESVSLTLATREHALDVVLPRIRQEAKAMPQARIGLVAADRPADVLPIIGWSGLVARGEPGPSLLELVAVLRSWEDRFGARLIDIGFADLRLLVDRPPRTLAAAQQIAAEHLVLADECTGCRDISGLAAELVNTPIWTFWWD